MFNLQKDSLKNYANASHQLEYCLYCFIWDKEFSLMEKLQSLIDISSHGKII